MRQTLKVQIDEKKEYLIEISDCSVEKTMNDINEFTKGQRRLIVISKRVYKLYNKILNLKKEEIFLMPDGEKEKNFKNYAKILEKASEIGLTRTDIIIAIGGGVVGDIAGFAASTYMRGIDFIQVPTTLLSAVDSSVGGKTAIDLGHTKNIVGSFYQPKKVYINTNFLNTLDNKQYHSGLGEVLKYAFIEKNCGYKVPIYLFEFLTLNLDKIMERESITLARVIEYCLNMKIAVVEQDEKESGLRKILNFGHTFGHALESITDFKKYTHGEAVVYGMFFILDWAYKKEYINHSYYRLSVELLEKYGFKRLEDIYSKENLIEFMKKDKKAVGNKITFIVPCEKKQVKEIKLAPIEVEYMF